LKHCHGAAFNGRSRVYGVTPPAPRRAVVDDADDAVEEMEEVETPRWLRFLCVFGVLALALLAVLLVLLVLPVLLLPSTSVDASLRALGPPFTPIIPSPPVG
jgi:hypothetical protein